jgi:hypothetical protein
LKRQGFLEAGYEYIMMNQTNFPDLNDYFIFHRDYALEARFYEPSLVKAAGFSKKLYQKLLHPALATEISRLAGLTTLDACYDHLQQKLKDPSFSQQSQLFLSSITSKTAAAAFSSPSPESAVSIPSKRPPVCVNCGQNHYLSDCPHPCTCLCGKLPKLCDTQKKKIVQIRERKYNKCKTSLPPIPAVIDSAATGIFLQSSSSITNYLPYPSTDPSRRISIGNSDIILAAGHGQLGKTSIPADHEYLNESSWFIVSFKGSESSCL